MRAEPAGGAWRYSFVAALEPGRTSWTAPLAAVRLGPTGDANAVTAAHVPSRMTNAVRRAIFAA